MPGTSQAYRGRFAPSPTGPLHLGSLIAALASYLDARHHRGCWLVRMEDLDPPREEPGAADRILQSLLDHGLAWDEDVLWQSKRTGAYQATLEQLKAGGHLFRCDCTRALLGPGGACAGRCLPRQHQISAEYSLRVTVPDSTQITFKDSLQGRINEELGNQLPDFVLRRKDGLFAYQLAVVVDDAFQGITHIVRGSDLLDSTARQIHLQQLLGFHQPRYSHLPVITDEAGQKFSKQNHAPPLISREAALNLRQALKFLGQAAPPARTVSVGEILKFALESWDLSTLPGGLEIPASSLSTKG